MIAQQGHFGLSESCKRCAHAHIWRNRRHASGMYAQDGAGRGHGGTPVLTARDDT